MNGIGFQNMKVFKYKQWFDFCPITLLSGTNNSGKSSVISAMQMLQENLQHKNKYTIDQIINTEFRLKSNQSKHGSIDSFVNRDSSTRQFSFEIKVHDIQYVFLIEVNEGLESFGKVKSITASDYKTEEVLFVFERKNNEPHLSCRYKINYMYFVKKLQRLCSNTLNLYKRKTELDILKSEVNLKRAEPAELERLANEIANQFSVYVIVDKIFEYTVDTKESYTEWTYWFSNIPFNGVESYQRFDELGVLFKDSHEGNSLSSYKGLLPESEFNDYYLDFINHGIFNFEQLFSNNSEAINEFNSLILKYYDTEATVSRQLFCDDLLTVLSNTFWDIEELYSYEDELLVPVNLVQNYLKCHPDFGLIASTFVLKRKNDQDNNGIEKSNYVANNFLKAKLDFDFSEIKMQSLIKNKFFESLFSKFRQLVFTYYDYKTEGSNFQKRDKILLKYARDFIFKEIDDKIVHFELGFNNIFISSNRFKITRSYNFNDNSDFTEMLKTIDKLKGSSKESCLDFINKWIKEFGLADELILTPDIDTGNFKAYLKADNKLSLLADFGLGTNQLLPIIFSLAIHFYSINPITLEDEFVKRTVIIEEPEANLHPALQSKLADLFVDAFKKFGVQIIAETHSEYLVRKLQYLVGSSKSEILPSEVIIYYFYKPDHNAVLNNLVCQVERIEIDNLGRLTKEFGIGFFDEADRIAFDIFNLSYNQSN